MVYHQPGNKPLFEPMIVDASLSLSELKKTWFTIRELTLCKGLVLYNYDVMENMFY